MTQTTQTREVRHSKSLDSQQKLRDNKTSTKTTLPAKFIYVYDTIYQVHNFKEVEANWTQEHWSRYSTGTREYNAYIIQQLQQRNEAELNHTRQVSGTTTLTNFICCALGARTEEHHRVKTIPATGWTLTATTTTIIWFKHLKYRNYGNHGNNGSYTLWLEVNSFRTLL